MKTRKDRLDLLVKETKHFRNPETQEKENAMDDFLYFVDYECELDTSKEIRDYIQDLVNRYVGYNIEKVKAGEQEMLFRWTGITK